MGRGVERGGGVAQAYRAETYDCYTTTAQIRRIPFKQCKSCLYIPAGNLLALKLLGLASARHHRDRFEMILPWSSSLSLWTDLMVVCVSSNGVF